MINPAEAFSFNEPRRISADEYEVFWTVPADLPYLEGHFPGRPILPGVAIVDACLVLAEKVLGEVRLNEVLNAKFLSPVEPEQNLKVLISRMSPEEWIFKWTELAPEGPEQSRAELRLSIREI